MSCPLCNFFGMVANPDGDQSCRLMVYSADFVFTGQSGHWCSPRNVLGVKNTIGSLSRPHRLISANIGSDAFGVRSIDSNPFNHTMAGHWLRYCQLNHPEVCYPESIHTPSLRVIDCQIASVVHAPTNCQYVALSYVWGAPSPLNPKSSCSLDILRMAPKVIVDSVELVKKLGFRYLWVDRYCIDQLDAIGKHEQICHMDTIYSSAQFTIIAAASGDPNDGLPGIHGTLRRPLQLSLQVGNHQLVSSLAPPTIEIPRSAWANRGWTF